MSSRAHHIPPVHTALPPFALPPIAFPFRQLAGLAGRAPIGGAREVALGCFLAARLAAERLGPEPMSEVARASREAGCRGWLGTLALPAPVRVPLARCLEAAASGSVPDLAKALRLLSAAATEYLDPSARAELDLLVTQLGG
ncbi:MAG: hypothetical protein JWL60_2519 [Gemmatimonadetes bacterium]|jgi:hypothetical protein|nr:hypothetical protein [Gemmatimonadota bacterium]